MIVNASETGLLIQSPNNVPVGTKLNIAVLFSKGFYLANFEVLAEVVWTKTQLHEGRQGYELGLKFIQIFEEDRQKLKHLFGDGPWRFTSRRSRFKGRSISPGLPQPAVLRP
jgi:hypothetical protein